MFCQNWFNRHTIPNFDTSHIASNLNNFSSKLVTKGNGCFLTRINMLFCWNEDWPIQVFMQVCSTDSREFDRNLYLMRFYFRDFHFLDTNVLLAMPASSFHCFHMFLLFFHELQFPFRKPDNYIVSLFTNFVKKKQTVNILIINPR